MKEEEDVNEEEDVKEEEMKEKGLGWIIPGFQFQRERSLRRRRRKESLATLGAFALRSERQHSPVDARTHPAMSVFALRRKSRYTFFFISTRFKHT